MNNTPAFPCNEIIERDSNGHRIRSEISSTGLSMRDYFAARAMSSLVTRIPNVRSKKEGEKMIKEIADAAYFFADAMLAAREAK